MGIIGHLDRRDEAFVEGWVTNTDALHAKVVVEIMLRGQVIGRCVANQFRQDLKDASLGDGTCAFSFQTPAFIPKSEINKIGVRFEESDLMLPGAEATATDPPAPETVSQFGGLWIDRSDWLDQLAKKHRSQEISDQLCEQIFHFVRDGYLIISGAVAAPLIEQVNEAIERAWVSPPPGLMVETFVPDGQMRICPPSLEYRMGEGGTKMLDLFAHSGAVREAIAAPPVIQFLTAIFGDRPKAFQSLNFWNGSQQPMHKDSAYVKVDSNPMHLAATWLALEDVEGGAGELEYYVGSHRAPDFLFGGISKWMESYVKEHDTFLQSLHRDARTFGHRRSSFLAKKGDVLIWHADLAHGGSKITKPASTRKSLVAHFTPASDEPYYRRVTRFQQAELNGCDFVSGYCGIGARSDS